MSPIEAVAKVAEGCALAIAMRQAVFPASGAEAALDRHLAIGWAFVAASRVRGYALRRRFERLRRARPSLDPARTAWPRPGRGDLHLPGWFEASPSFVQVLVMPPANFAFARGTRNTTDRCPRDKVNRQFRAPAPNVPWVSDFT